MKLPTPAPLPAALVLAALLLVPCSTSLLAWQIVEEDLDESELASGLPMASTELEDDALTAQLAAAAEQEAVGDVHGAVAALTRLIDQLAPRQPVTRSAAAQEVLVRALAQRARLRFELGDSEGADLDLRTLITEAPGYTWPESGTEGAATEDAPAAFLARLADLRKDLVGTLRLVIDPPDAAVRIDDRLVEIADPEDPTVPALAGRRRIEVTRPGYTPHQEEVDLRAGRTVERTVLLERTSAIVRLTTRPPKTQVVLDGVVRGVTSGTAPEGLLPQGTVGVYQREEFSDELVFPVEQGGPQILEIGKEGFRSYRAELYIDDQIDYALPPIVLEESHGVAILQNLPPDVTVRVDGAPARIENPGAPSPRLKLSPGVHQLIIERGPTKMFATQLRIADRQTVEVNARLRPGLAMLGVLGDDPATPGDLQQALTATLADGGKWTTIDYAAAARPALTTHGVDAGRLRAAAQTGDAPGIDWAALQTELGRALPGLVYVLAVPSNDLTTSETDLWLLPAAPGPPRPDRLRVRLDDPEDVRHLKAAFNQTLPLRRPWVGMLVIDTNAATHPVVAALTPDGPAAAAGVKVGDQVVGVAKITVLDAADFEARIAAAESGETVELALQTANNAPRAASIALGATPTTLGHDDADRLDALAFADLRLLAERAEASERWVIELDQALLLLDAGAFTEAARLLRTIRAPKTATGLGQPAVDYWLGVALLAVGPNFRNDATAAFTRAAAAPKARLHHADGPWLAPRARLRLHALQAPVAPPPR